MHAGPGGMKAKDILETANVLRLGDWDDTKGKRSHISTTISKEPRFVHVGNYKYTLRCFPGAQEVPTARDSAAAAGALPSHARVICWRYRFPACIRYRQSLIPSQPT